MAEKAYLSPTEVGRLLGLPAVIVRECVRTGILPGESRRGRVVIATADLRAWLAVKNEAALRSVAGEGTRR